MTKKFASILVLCLQLACGVLSTPEPTATPTSAPTFTPVPTAVVVSTETSIPTSDVLTGECVISTDNTYGYTETNPIEVGGDAFDGPARERAYLDNLLGPNGESLLYERQGSVPTDTTILDIYIVTGSGINETLYLDEYNYAVPQAPVGFTCKGEFPLSAP